jgi:hypothetical protein
VKYHCPERDDMAVAFGGVMGTCLKEVADMRQSRITVALGMLFIIATAEPSYARMDARTAQLRLLCARLSEDLTEPGGIMQFRRCLTHPPVAAIRQNARRPHVQLPPLYHPSVPLTQ